MCPNEPRLEYTGSRVPGICDHNWSRGTQVSGWLGRWYMLQLPVSQLSPVHSGGQEHCTVSRSTRVQLPPFRQASSQMSFPKIN